MNRTRHSPIYYIRLSTNASARSASASSASARSASARRTNTRRTIARRTNTRNTGALSLNVDDDIGQKNVILFPDKNMKRDTIIFKTIDFSSDILQYLIKHGKFTINPNSPSSESVLSLSINDSNIPLLESDTLKPTFVDYLIVQIKIKNLFDAYKFCFPKDEQLSEEQLSDQQLLLEYNRICSSIKSYYKRLITENKNGNLCEHDNFGELVKVPIPCSTIYSSDIIPASLDSRFLEDDFILSYVHINRFKIIKDCIMKFYFPKFQVDTKQTIYLDNNGEIYKTVIIDDTIPHPDAKSGKKFVIIGTNYPMQIGNILFKDLPEYNDVLNDQRDNYESWLKEYTFQELQGKINKEDIEFADYILNKNKIANIDFDYIKKMKLLSDEEFDKMKEYLRWKVNKMCSNKFNKPNCTLLYKWVIMELSINSETNMPDLSTLEYAINTIREVNSNHKAVLERIQNLSWTRMLEVNGIIVNRPEDKGYKQVFTETELPERFELKSYYVHPLNYKINYYYRENKVFFIEDLIANCGLVCDGEFPGMEKYKGLPFYAVVPIEITSFPDGLNSSFYFRNVKCNSESIEYTRNYTRNNQRSKTNNNAIERANKRTTQTLTYRNALLRQSKSASQQESSKFKLLDRTIIKLVDGTELLNKTEKQSYLESLFNSQTIKVYSTLITFDGLLVVTLLDIESNKFYYLLLEVNLKQSKSALHKKKIQNLLGFFFKGYDNKYVYGMRDVPLINIYLVNEFTPGNKIFTTLGNECIYKLFSEKHDFFTNPRITVDYNGEKPTTEINNFYGYMLIALINMINPIKSTLEEALRVELTDGEMLKYYRINDDKGYRMISEVELLDASNVKTDKISYKSIKDNKGVNGNPRSETQKIEIDELFPNNNIFITIGKDYILIMNRFYEDELKTEEIPRNKQQLKHHFKFTTWTLTREYLLECLKIIDQHSGQDLFHVNSIPTLYRLTSLFDGNIVEIDSHIQEHSKFIEKYIIDPDPYICKYFKPEILINSVSDISSSVMHIHFIMEIIHESSIKKINNKKELLSKNVSLYSLPTLYNFRFNKLMDKIKTNSETIQECFNNPYTIALKLSYLLQLPIA